MRNAGTIPEVVLSARPLIARALLAQAQLMGPQLARDGKDAGPQRYDLPAHCA
jgi:hypothetical protein